MSYGSPFAYCSTVAAALVIYVATSAVPFFLHKQYIIIPIKTAPPTEPSTMATTLLSSLCLLSTSICLGGSETAIPSPYDYSLVSSMLVYYFCEQLHQ